MKLYHTSGEEIKNIYTDGMFGDCLFFSTTGYYVMTASEQVYCYIMKMKRKQLIECFQLDIKNKKSKKIVKKVAERFNVDKAVALELLCEETHIWIDAESSWWLQMMQAKMAVAMGYKGTIATDEQGEVAIVPMKGKRKKLKFRKLLK